jgi:purine-cytosine permease-like protein
VYTGPIAKVLGGTDIGFFVGFFAAALGYALIEKLRLRTGAGYDSLADPAA